MGGLMTRIRRAIGAELSDAERSRRWLVSAQRRRTRVDLLELPHDAGRNGEASEQPSLEDQPVMAATIEEVGGDSFIISQPLVGGASPPILTNSLLRIAFYDDRKHVSGIARNLGRARISSGAGTPLYGYRLSMPSLIEEGAERRDCFRLPVGIDLAPNVEVVAYGETTERVRGKIENLSAGGALVCLRKAVQGVRQGREVVLNIALPAPVGNVQVRAEVRHLSVRGDSIAVGLQFRNDIAGLDELIRSMEIKRIQRRRSA
jgi:hypothetical protein